MKKFTFILTLFLLVLFAGAQNKNDLQNKLQRAHEKNSKITQRTAFLLKQIERKSLNQESFLKSAAATQKLDSTVNRILNTETQAWQNDYKDEFNYDSELKNTFWLEKEWNLSTKTWDVSFKTELGYDNQDRVNSMLMYSRDSLTQPITPISKFLIFYHSDGTQDSTLSYSTETAGASWLLYTKDINHYNASKQLIKTEMWMLDEDLGVLTLSVNVVYTYTASGKIKSSSTSYVIEGDEMLWSKIEYNYDGSGKLTSIENSMLNFMTSALEKTSRSTYQYNASGDVSNEIYSTWNGTSWVDVNKTEYQYNAAGDVSNEIYSTWNGTSWVDVDKTEYQYNAAGDVSVEIYSTWNGTLWVEEDKDEYTYSTTNFSDVVFPFFSYLYGLDETNDFSMNKVITGVNSFVMLGGSWKNTGKTFFYYSDGTSTNITEFANTLFTVYPNPTSEQVNFSWKGNYESLSLEMYQITGAKVMEQIIYSGKPVSISKLENGVYFFKLLNGKQMVHTGKMIKR